MNGIELNSYFEKLIAKEIAFRVDRGQQQDEIFKKTHWTLPSHILVFLKSKIDQITE
jgi:hypothetical protein